MRSSEAIERVLTLQTMNTHESEAYAHSGDCPSCKELESLCPLLAKALKLAMEALEKTQECGLPTEYSVQIKGQQYCYEALTAIERVFE